MAELLDPRTVRRLADQIGLRPTKQRGQNFVVDANTVRRIVAKSGIGADDVVLEIGPGLGSLTLGLLETGAAVTAIEIEDALAELLPATVAELQPGNAERLRVINADALAVTELPGPPPTAVVANLPYNVSVPVLLHLLATFEQWRTGLVMVQLEVADRLVAKPGSKVYGVPSAKLAWYADAERVGTVPPTVFWPAPNVDSGLVRLVRRDPPVTSASREQVFTLIDAAFAQRRKMLRSALSGIFGSSAAASAAITAAGPDPTSRGEVLDINDFARLAEQLAPASVHVRVPGKINLALRVAAQRPDGYHDLATVFQAVSLHEDVHATARSDGEITLLMSGEGSEDLPTDQTNLAVRAAHLLRELHGHPGLGIVLRITKQIPMAGGMAGGSADAAGVLLAANHVWRLGLELDPLAEVAAQLGSDVAFLLYGGNALGQGRGERLTPLAADGRLEWVFALAPGGLSTPAVYRAFDELAAAGELVPSDEIPPGSLDELASGDPHRVAAELFNALQPAALALYPELADTLALGERPGVLASLVCGSGPTCAFLCADAAVADDFAGELAGRPQIRAVRRAFGPVSGPRPAQRL